MPDAKESHGFKAQEVSALSSLMSAMQPSSKQEIAREVAEAKNRMHETTEPEDDTHVVSEARTPQDGTLAPVPSHRTAPSPVPVVEAQAPPARPITAVTLIDDKPVRSEGIVKSWISDKITAALTDLGVAHDHWDKIEDAVFAAAISGKLGNGTVGPETEKAISDLVASLAEPAATKGDDELEPIGDEPSGKPDEIEPLGMSEPGEFDGIDDTDDTPGIEPVSSDMDEVPPEHEPSDMDEPEGDLDDEFSKLFGKDDEKKEPDDDEFGDLEIGGELEDEEPEEKGEKKPAKKEPEKKKDEKPEKKDKDKEKEKDEDMLEAYGVRWSEESMDEGIIIKQAFFKSADERAHFIHELMESPDFREIIDYPEDITLDASNTSSGEQPAGELELPDNIDDRGGDAQKHWESLSESKLSDVQGRDLVEYEVLAFLERKGGKAEEDSLVRAMTTWFGFNGGAVDTVTRTLCTRGEIERSSGPDGRGYLAIAEKGKTRMQELGESIKTAPLVEVKLEEGTEVIYHVRPGLEFSSGTDHTVAPRRYMAPLALPPGLAEAVLYGILDPREAIVKLADAAIDAKINDELQHMGYAKHE